MDARELAPIPQISIPGPDEVKRRFTEFHYDRPGDTLFFYFGEIRPGAVHYLDTDTFVIFDPETSEAFALMIEHFEELFLPAHPELATAWHKMQLPSFRKQARPRWTDILLETLRPVIKPAWGYHQAPSLAGLL